MFERIVIVTKKTALEELLLRHNTRGQVAFYLESRGSSIEEYDTAHAAYSAAVETVMPGLPRELPRTTVPREQVSTFLFRQSDLVIAIGPDGLFVNTAKYLEAQPILTVNPDPVRVDGVLMRFQPREVAGQVAAMLEGEFETENVTLAKAATNDGQTLYAVNDFLIGRRDMISSRYCLRHGRMHERQSSSGILVSTGVGSTGWIKSVAAGAAAITGGSPREAVPFPANSRYLLFAVREPFETRYTKANIVFGRIEDGNSLVIESEMSEGGAIFSDGVVEDAIEFNAGVIVTVTVADKSARLVKKPAHKLSI